MMLVFQFRASDILDKHSIHRSTIPYLKTHICHINVIIYALRLFSLLLLQPFFLSDLSFIYSILSERDRLKYENKVPPSYSLNVHIYLLVRLILNQYLCLTNESQFYLKCQFLPINSGCLECYVQQESAAVPRLRREEDRTDSSPAVEPERSEMTRPHPYIFWHDKGIYLGQVKQK